MPSTVAVVPVAAAVVIIMDGGTMAVSVIAALAWSFGH